MEMFVILQISRIYYFQRIQLNANCTLVYVSTVSAYKYDLK